MDFYKALKSIRNKQLRRAGTRAYYSGGDVYFSRIFGFRRDGNRYEPDERYAPAIRTIIIMLAAGKTILDIKSRLDEMGARDSSNNRYSISRIIAIAERPIYAGFLLQRGHFININNLTPLVTFNMWREAGKQLRSEKKKLI